MRFPDTGSAITDFLDRFWPVGSVFVSVVDTNPAVLLGVGVWLEFGQGRVLVGQDTIQPAFDGLLETGGSTTQAAAGTVSQPTFAGDALAAHSHGAGTYVNAATSAGTPAGTNSAPAFTGSAWSAPAAAWPAGVPTHSGITATFTGNAVAAASTTAAPKLLTGNTSTGVAPVTTATGTVTITSQGTVAWPAGVPTLGAYTPAGSVAAPTFTGSALATHTHTLSGSSASVTAGTPSGTVSQPAFTGTPTSVVQPYCVVKFWRRVS